MKANPQDRSAWQVGKVRRDESDLDPELDNMTAAERIQMMWPLALNAWAFMGKPVAEQGLPRDFYEFANAGVEFLLVDTIMRTWRSATGSEKSLM